MKKNHCSSIIDCVELVQQHLEHYFEGSYGLAYHEDANPDSGANTAVPTIYPFMMPSAELQGDYPAHTPCIVIVVENMQVEGVYNVTLYLCVAYAGIANKEVVHPVPEAPGKYRYDEEATGYDTATDLALIKSSLRFTEDVYKAMTNITSITVKNLTLDPPDPVLPDHPYCITQIHFEIHPNGSFIGKAMDIEKYY